MKNVLLTILFQVIGFQSAQAITAQELKGSEYCRTVYSEGYFGQPVGEREHCVTFYENDLMDDANTFFGRPPETFQYQVQGDVILILKDHQWVPEYTLVGNELRKNHIVLVKK